MAFISIEFIIFFSLSSIVFFSIPQPWKLPFLLLASLIFYGYSSPLYAVLLLILMGINYAITRGIGSSEVATTRTRLLILGVVLNVGTLIVFKYTNLFDGTFAPLGISFYTFTQIAYVIDVYRAKFKAEDSFITFGAFVSFFPNLISGPIERGNHLIPQLKQAIKFDYERTVEGFRLILWGAFKKIVIADRLAVYVNQVYGSPQQYDGAVLLVATFFLAFQIYADFSGYTDMARGIARILGFDLFENFQQPYFSRSIIEFWRRWHMSLTTWIREYLFFPLSKFLLRRTKRRYPRVLEVITYLIIMGVVGLWHGANWTFVVWGLLHGAYMGIESLLNVNRGRPEGENPVMDVARMILTFVLVEIAWIFFRANTLNDAMYILTHLLDVSGGFRSIAVPFSGAAFGPRGELILSVGLIAFLMGVDWLDRRGSIFTAAKQLPFVGRRLLYYILVAGILLSLILNIGSQSFVYFKF